MDEVGLGKAIQTARQAAGLTQQQLCQQAEMSYSTLAKIERGAIKTPSVFTVHKIAQVLNLSLDTLLGNVPALARTAPPATTTKHISNSGISFVYLDINGCLVQFFHAAFSKLSHETGVPSDSIESTFWHYNDAVCRGEMTLEDFNKELAKRFSLPEIDWKRYYLDAIEPITEMEELVTWAATNYRVGLLSNIMPTFIDNMLKSGILPRVPYDAIIDSSVVGAIKPEEKIYQIAQEAAGVPAEQILFVDDSRTNLMAAERLGWRVLWFDDMRPAESVERIRSALEL